MLMWQSALAMVLLLAGQLIAHANEDVATAFLTDCSMYSDWCDLQLDGQEDLRLKDGGDPCYDNLW